MIRNLSRRFFSLSRGEQRVSIPLQPGDELSGFKVDSVQYFPDFDIKLFSLTHQVTKTRYFHFDSSDMNNMFTILFKTIPLDNKGKPHILEHIVLCGSEKFPVKDPFMKMTSRSLNTFMNAMTGCDMTLYPFSTQNKKDFQNLLSVYADATLRPRITHMDFLQEAWRYELADQCDPESPLTFQGVVLNEMKGILESSESLFYESISKHLFNGTPYSLGYGGIPSDIPKLEYEELKSYYGLYYHPSNMSLLSYGDLDFREHLDFLQENYLKFYEFLPLNTDVPKSTIESPVRVVENGPVPAAEINEGSSTKFGITFLCNDIREKDHLTSVGLELLSFMMFETPSSPFYVEFLEGGHASNYCPGNGYENMYQEATFTIGLSSISPKKGMSQSKRIEEIETKIMKMLEELHKKGFEKDLVDIALHQFELESFVPKKNFGMNLMNIVAPAINHKNEEIITGFLNMKKTLEEIRTRAQNGFFQELIGKYLLNNQKRVYLTMKPSKDFLKNVNKQEESALKEANEKISKEEKARILEQSAQLKKVQEKKEDLSVLPSLSVSDIPLEGIQTHFQITKVQGVPVYICNINTNSMTYLRIKVDTTNMPSSVHHYLKLFVNFFPRMGTENMSHHQMADQWNLYTTSPDMKVLSFTQLDSVEKEKNCVVLTIGCLDRNIDKMFELLLELLTEVYFQDYKFISSQLKIESSEAANSFVSNAFRYSKEYVASTLNPADFKYNSFKEACSLCKLGSAFSKTAHRQEYMDDIIFHFVGTMNYLFKHKGILSFSFHTSSRNNEKVLQKTEGLLRNLKFLAEPDLPAPSEELDDDIPKFKSSFLKTYFSLPTQVNYVSEAFKGPAYLSKDFPKLQVLSHLLNGTKLHEEIREKGGAYGSGSSVSPNGVITLFSYMDPHSLKTYESFEKAVSWTAAGKFTQEDLDQAKLSLFSNEDQIVLPHERGLSQFILGLSDDQRQEHRTRQLGVQRQDLIDVANAYLLQPMQEKRSTRGIFGSEEADLEMLRSKGWSTEVPVEGLQVNEDYEGNEEDDE